MHYSGVERSLNDLLRRFVRDGDVAAMEDIVRRTRPRLLRIARRIGGAQDAEDSVQTAYHALLRSRRLDRDVPLEGWLVTATVKGQCTVPERLAHCGKVRLRIIHGLTLVIKNSHTNCKSLLALKAKYYYA
jgi:hypothetical protein